jgi:hypothetical protein
MELTSSNLHFAFNKSFNLTFISQQITQKLLSIFKGEIVAESYVEGALKVFSNISLIILVTIGCRLFVLAITEISYGGA